MAELLTIMQLMIYPKNMPTSIGWKLTNEEFKCHCTRPECHYTLASENFTNAWYNLRVKVNHGLKVNSGFRCQAHNKDEGGVADSNHTTGNAVDISTEGYSAEKKENLIHEAKEYFDYVKIYDTFIHCQING